MNKGVPFGLRIPLIAAALGSTIGAIAQEPTDSLDFETDLDEIVITRRLDSRRKMRDSAMQSELLTSAELTRAACCNLGESFATNPSVDVNYSDAASGARQIRLLGLPGTYVQMLTENIPAMRGATAPFGLGYIPGPWMQSIQISKGASSVKNGYESVTGQINVEFLKPQTDQSVAVNAYADHMGRVEGNAAGNIHLSDKLSAGLLLHGENSFASHDANDDGFADSPRVRQLSVMNRWGYFGKNYILQAAMRYLGERRKSGQTGHHAAHVNEPYLIDISTQRGEAWLKNAYIFDADHGGNVALILSASIHDQKSDYGHRSYDVIQKNLYASLMFERNFGTLHALSAGLSLNMDDYRQHYRLIPEPAIAPTRLDQAENTAGAYAQYTFNLNSRIVAMAGLRYDHSSIYGSMVTPRIHARWNVADPLSLHFSAGKGYRTPYALADNSYLLASSRAIIIEPHLKQEEGWNLGGGLSGTLYPFNRRLEWGVEYYYTSFINQTAVDLDRSPMAAYIINLPGRSFSHSAQVELTFRPIDDMNITAAYRYNDVKMDYGYGLVEKPLTSRSKGLISVGYTPMMGIWQFDLTLAITGKGRLPEPATDSDGSPLWNSTYRPFPTLNAQITRNFRHWSIYIGGENLTNYRQRQPIIGADNPWGPAFDATMIYAPVHGAMAYIGFRYTFTKY